jgi:hypothetical protein
VAPPRRPAEEAALDPWVEVTAQQERQKTLRLEADIANEQRDDERRSYADRHRHDRRMQRIKYYGYAGIAFGVSAGIVGFVLALTNHLGNSDELRNEREVERTEQVEACVSLDEPIERQFCLVTLGIDQTPEEGT